MNGANPELIRQRIQAAMLSFICETSLYNLSEIATVINVPLPLLTAISQGNAPPMGQSENNLIKLYTIALESYKKE